MQEMFLCKLQCLALFCTSFSAWHYWFLLRPSKLIYVSVKLLTLQMYTLVLQKMSPTHQKCPKRMHKASKKNWSANNNTLLALKISLLYKTWTSYYWILIYISHRRNFPVAWQNKKIMEHVLNKLFPLNCTWNPMQTGNGDQPAMAHL